MVSITMKVGQKGQIVIPKAFRREYGIETDTEVVLKDIGEGILLQKPYPNVAEGFERLAQQAKGKVSLHAIEEEYDQRLQRSGLK